MNLFQATATNALTKWSFVWLLTTTAAADAAVHQIAAADPAANSAAPPLIDPLFDCTAANSAWGLAYSGKVVDRQGHIWRYQVRDKLLPKALREGDRTYYSSVDLRAKYIGAKPDGGIAPEIVAEKSVLIDKAASGKITHDDTGTRDAGSSECHAYVFDAATGRYRDVELGSDAGVADTRSDNAAPEAKVLLEWLGSVGVAR